MPMVSMRRLMNATIFFSNAVKSAIVTLFPRAPMPTRGKAISRHLEGQHGPKSQPRVVSAPPLPARDAHDNDPQMSSRLPPHLRRLQDEAIFIIREVVAEFAHPVMLYSIGKDSSVMLHLAL